MKEPKIFSFGTALAAGFLVCLFTFNSFAQQQTAGQQQSGQNYEVVLQVITASNGAGDKSAGSVPSPLAGVVRRLKTMYSFADYRLNLTYFQRVANAGSLEFKGVLSAPNQDVYTPVFSDFSFGQLSTQPDAAGQNSILIQNFRFGQRVPIRTASLADDGGKSNAVNYEQVGLSMHKIGLPLDAPTIIGNLSASKPDELSFLILTVKRAEN